MSTLTKVLIVLLVLLAVVHSAVLMAYLSQDRSWKAYALDLEQRQANLQTELKTYLSTADKTRDALLLEKKALLEQLDTATGQLGIAEAKTSDLKFELGRETADNTKFQAELASLTRSLTLMQQSSQYATEQLDLVRDTLAKLKGENTLLEKQVAELTMDRDQLEAEIRSNKERIAFLQDQKRRAQAGQSVTPAPSYGAIEPSIAVAAKTIRARVIDVNMGRQLATINAGSIAGVAEGTKFIIFDEGYVGDLEITRVERDQSVGTIVLYKKPVEIGDDVATNLD